LWRRRDIRLSTKGRVYCAAVRSVLPYGSETWPVGVEDIRRLLVFDHRCLRNIARISWDHRPWEVNARNLTDEFLNAYEDLLGNYYIENMDRYSHILTVDGSTVDVYDDDDIYIIAQNATEIDLSGQYLMRDDYKLLEWRLALRYASSLINSRLE
ncbi:unnamed protein product, partial [Schistosoma curassoni]|uniref:Pecanex-like protein n=1 Tax=Schistosoma curassoni TaxID=6186 RepID=A0A183L196_9TREM